MTHRSKKLLGLYSVIMLAVIAVLGSFDDKNIDTAQISNQNDTAVQTVPGSQPDGSLVRVQENETVYYIENGKRRQIDTPETFRTHGFSSGDVVIITAEELSRHPEGERITADSKVVFPGEYDTLPDLSPFAPRDLRLAKRSGRNILRFSAVFWNKGKGAFEMVADPQDKKTGGDSYQEVTQLIQTPGKTFRNKLVGNFMWHAVHNHYHYDQFADYIFQMVRPASGSEAVWVPSRRQKTTFCMRDDRAVDLALLGSPKAKFFSKCGLSRQGVSIGWADVYDYTLPDQYIDVHDLPAGVYSLSFLVDPNQRFVEGRKDNNISTTIIQLDAKKNILKVIAAGSPFETGRNIYPEGMLIRAGGDGDIFVIHAGKKRWLRTGEIFDAYSFKWEQVYTLTQSIVDAIPPNALVRLQGTKEIYMLNEVGYRRHVLTPDAVVSYGLTGADVADINQTEYDRYPLSNLIMLSGGTDAYLIDGATKRKLGPVETLEGLGHNRNAIHIVSQTDFDAYNTSQ